MNPDHVATMASRAKALGRPHATRDVLRAVFG
jgi:hypothetical protein